MDQTVAKHESNRHYWTSDDIRQKISNSKVVIFSKGTREKPRCGFSEQTFRALEGWDGEFDVVDVSEDSSIVAALRSVAGRKALPMISVNGSFLSCSDELPRMLQNGELRQRVEKILDS